MTIEDVSRHLGLHWHTIKEIDKRNLSVKYKKPRLRDVEYLAIDEIAYKKGHKYKTIVYDLSAGRAVYVGEGRKAKSLDTFWKRLHSSGARVKAVATDMWEPYWSSVSKNVPNAKVVFDLFHIVKQYNKDLDHLRVQLYKSEPDKRKRNIIRGSKWMVLKNETNLSDDKNPRTHLTPREHLDLALSINQPLATAYYMKENLKLIWQQKDYQSGLETFEYWCQQADESGIEMLQKFAEKLRYYKPGILNWYHHPISTGKLEGFNNKIKVLKRKAYGYRDDDYFALRILSLHDTRHALMR